MAVFNEPTKWQTALVNSGDANTIPQSTPAGTGEASFDDGFPQITQVPIGAGGIAPDRKDFNGLFKILGDWIFFNQNGGLPTYSANFDYVVGRYVVYNNTLYKCIQANGTSSTVVAPDSVTPAGSDYWKDIENQDNTSLIPNQLIVSPVPLTDANLHLLDGALLSGSGAYSAYVTMMGELYTADPTSPIWVTEADWQDSITNYGVCGKFVYDSVNNTLRLPKISGFIEGTLSTIDLGKVTGAGLPNIIGTFSAFGETDSTATGSFSVVSSSKKGASSTTPYDRDNPYIDFDAQRSSSVYGNSNTVQPQSVSVYYYIVVGTISKTDIQIDIDNVLTDLGLKADTDLSNATPTSAFATTLNNVGIRTVVESYVNGSSGYRVWSDGFCEQWGLVDNVGDTTGIIALLKNYANIDYYTSINFTTELSAHYTQIGFVKTNNKTVSSFDYTGALNVASNPQLYWHTLGFIS